MLVDCEDMLVISPFIGGIVYVCYMVSIAGVHSTPLLIVLFIAVHCHSVTHVFAFYLLNNYSLPTCLPMGYVCDVLCVRYRGSADFF